MFKEFFLFEFRYRKRRPVTYVYFGIIFLLSFLGIASPIRAAVGQIMANAPYLITVWTIVLSFVFTMITSAVMGVSIVRDFDHNTESILFSTPIKKIDYLLGRFCGSVLILVLINCAIWMGLMSGFALAKFIPWEVSWIDKEMLPFNAWHYLQPFFLFTVTNIFAMGALFFMSGALGRNSIVIYTQGILLIVLYQIGNNLLLDLDLRELAATIDPFGVQTFQYVTRYWTPAEQNTRLVPLDGLMLYNRILWVGIGVLALVITYFGFSFNAARKSPTGKKRATSSAPEPMPDTLIMPFIKRVFNTSTYLLQLIRMSFFYFRVVVMEIPFLAIVGSGMLLLFFNAANMNSLYGTGSYPTTNAILTLLNSFNLFFLIIAIFYSGELVWKERTINFNLILDAMPMPAGIGLLSKFIGLFLVYSVLLLVLIVCGVIIQTANGYFEFDLPVYFGTLFTSTLAFLVLYTVLSIFIQVLVNNKFLGFTLCVVFYIMTALFNQLGLEHGLWQFASGSLETFSEMNLYGHFVTPFAWFKLYWFAFSSILFCIAIVLSARGADSVLKMRWKAGKLRLTNSMITFALAALVVFLLSGFYIFYNTSVLNKFQRTRDLEEKRARYEKTFKKYEFIAQPKITEANIKVDLFPSRREFIAEGFYYLKNKTSQSIQDIHVQCNEEDQIQVDYIKFDHVINRTEANEEFRYFIYQLASPLLPGDSVKMNFKISFLTRGFVNSNSNTKVVYNGTFFNNSYFPGLGYNRNYELGDDGLRKKNGLMEKERMLPREDPRGLAVNLFGKGADRIRFEIVVSTEQDQIAIAPGYLQKEWRERSRRYFHYKTEAPISNFYSVVSARYSIRRDTWKKVNLEIYYHPGHEYNLGRMMEGMKDALGYCSGNFSPYQHHQLRILEFPRYSTFAQSFANTIPFSEGLGFILRITHPEKDLDMAYYITAHEVAHQWWGHQVMDAGVKGNAMLSEGMSQYSALMVMKHAFPTETIERYLKHELDRYLLGRASERKKEQPLQLVEGQDYIAYNKASLVFFALQDYIGEDSLNAAFRRYNKAWAFKDSPHPTSLDLLKQVRRVTPDSLRYLVHDMFETITLFENKAVEAVYQEKSKGKFELTLTVSSQKIRADSTGMETRIPVNDWIEIGVFGKDDMGKDKLIYLKKHKITTADNKFTILLREKPRKAGIDPIHKLIDRNSTDNTVEATQFVELGNF
jgi:ABC-2 type transport system permease protein